MLNVNVGNLSFNSAEEDIKTLFEQYGPVNSVKVITDRQTGQSRGFAFVDMDKAEARKAIPALNGAEFEGRTLKVKMKQRIAIRNHEDGSRTHSLAGVDSLLVNTRLPN